MPFLKFFYKLFNKFSMSVATTIKTTITNIDDLPLEVKNELVVIAQLTEDEADQIFSDYDEVIELIRECGDRNETKDSCYIYKEWTIDTPSFSITVFGSNYLKDRCICDLEMNDEIQIINLQLQKERQQSDAERRIANNRLLWAPIIEGKTTEEILDILQNFTPKKK